jgi:serine/threonine protein kinase
VVPDVFWGFDHERDLLSSVRHPNIIELLEVIECDAGPFLVLELADTTAAHECDKAPMAESKLTRIAHAIAAALAYLHSDPPGGAILHRDIKPENMYLFGETWKLADFSGATRIASPFSIPITGIEDPWFVPPELDNLGNASVQSELYQLALSLLWLAIRRRPLATGNATAVRASAVSGDPQRQALAHSWQSLALGDLVASSLDPAPENRPASAAEFVAALDRSAA